VLATRSVMFNQAAAIRRRPLERIGGFNTSLKYLEDYDLSMRLAIEGPWAYIKESLSIWAGGEPNSLTKRAANDGIALNDCMLRILAQALASAQERGDASVERHVRRSIVFSRRALRGIQIGQSASRSERIVEQLRGQLDRYHKAILRRSPWFPRVKAINFEEFTANSHLNSQRLRERRSRSWN